MQVIVNPYHKSVTIDGVEVIQRILPFPDEANSIASITCNYNPDTRTVTEVSNIHRYVNHYIEKEYYYNNLPKFVDWFYAEKSAQAQEQTEQEKELAAVNNAIKQTQTVIAEAEGKLVAITKKIQEAQSALDALDNKVANVNQETLDAVTAVVLEATGTLPVRLAEKLPKRSLIERCRDVVNVKDYGAIGNGEANDTCAFEDATDVAIALHAPLYIPNGLYKVDKLPSVLAYGGGVLFLSSDTNEVPVYYHAMDLLFKPNGGIERDTETGLYKVSESLTIPIVPDTPDSPDLIYTPNTLPLSPVNTQLVIDNDGEWVVPVTGHYSVLLMGAGYGGMITETYTGSCKVQAGRSGTINHFYKYLVKDTHVTITIGQGGKGYNEFDTSSGTTKDDVVGGITEFDIHTSDNYPHRHYHTDCVETNTFVSLAGAGLGGGRYDKDLDIVHDGSYYAAGGGAYADYRNQKFLVSNGHRGAVILLFCNPDKDS